MLFACSYTLLVSWILYAIETPHEVSTKQERLGQISQAEDKLIADLLSLQASSATKSEWKRKATDVMTTHSLFLFDSFKKYQLSGEEVLTKQTQRKWTFAHAILFAVTMLTTIGYGNPVPTSFAGKLVCLLCAFFGIPIALVTVANLGKFLGIFLILAYRRLLTKCSDIQRWLHCSYKRSSRGANGDQLVMATSNQLLLPAAIVITFLLLYICFAAVLTHQLEWSWSLFECLYFSFVTTTTVGFGDLVPSSTGASLTLPLVLIFLGCVVTSMCIDLVGVSYLRKIHYLGRKIVALGDGLAIVGGRVVYVGDMCARFHSATMNLHRSTANTVSSRKNTFVPDEISMIEYIDHDPETVRAKHRQHTAFHLLGRKFRCEHYAKSQRSATNHEHSVTFGQTVLV
ncbi:unnamed protein product [Soboliphyme baturini]|uniref:Ion_trans_2 domain-containing protein n=1 Tax=Soboliphyme baturini TaxID=241478 RepID=A0A183IU73_9BILA|nr:unnamed protein product [Soboliphyme baturini]